MVRECRPPAREPGRSWLARRSTMATSTPANASSPANISPVGPAPAITTACSATTRIANAVLEVRHAVVLAEPGLFQLDSLWENVEQPATASEQDVDDVDPQLVDEPGGEVLLVDVRAHQPDPLLAGGLLRLRERTLDPVGDEREDRVRVRERVVRDDEARDLAERALAAPVVDRVVVRAAAHDHGAGPLGQVAEDALEHGRVVERPVVEPHPVLAQPLLRIVVRRCDVAVQGHAHVDHHAAHLASLVSVVFAEKLEQECIDLVCSFEAR